MILSSIKLSSIIATTLLIASATGFSVSTHAKYIDKATEKKLVKICMALKSNDRHQVRRTLRQLNINKQAVKRAVVCNSMDAVTFAMSENAPLTAAYLVGKNNQQYIALQQKAATTNNIARVTSN